MTIWWSTLFLTQRDHSPPPSSFEKFWLRHCSKTKRDSKRCEQRSEQTSEICELAQTFLVFDFPLVAYRFLNFTLFLLREHLEQVSNYTD